MRKFISLISLSLIIMCLPIGCTISRESANIDSIRYDEETGEYYVEILKDNFSGNGIWEIYYNCNFKKGIFTDYPELRNSGADDEYIAMYAAKNKGDVDVVYIYDAKDKDPYFVESTFLMWAEIYFPHDEYQALKDKLTGYADIKDLETIYTSE